MKKGKLVACILVVLLFVTACAPAAGPPAPAAGTPAPAAGTPAAQATAPDEPQPTGNLVIYSPFPQNVIDTLIPLFEEETGISVEVMAMGTGDALRRIDAEQQRPLADLLWSGGVSTVNANAHLFDYFVSDYEEYFWPRYRNVEGKMTRFNTWCSVIMYNTDLVDFPIRGYADLLNPALRGRIAFADPAGSSSSFEHLVVMLHAMSPDDDPNNGWDYVRQFIEQLDGIMLTSSSAVFRGVADGEYTVGLTFEQGGVQFLATDAPVNAVYMEEGTIFRGDVVAIINGAPNLYSARKFINWSTRRDIQQIMNDTTYRRSVRMDIDESPSMISTADINIITDDEVFSGAMREEWLERFREYFMDTFE